MYFLGIDIGTTGLKSMLFDEKLNIISQDYIEYDLEYSEFGVVEQNSIKLWEMTKQTIKSTLLASNAVPEEIEAISISAQGISFVPIDEEGNELYNIISWLDTRAQKQASEIKNKLDEDYIFKTTGKRINANYTLPKLMWIKENKPNVYQNTHKFLMVLDYITYKLTGEIKTDYSMASGTMMFDITRHKWDEKILDTCGIDKDKLPKVAEMGSVIGKMKGSAAYELGMDVGTIVVLGAQDQKCAALGAGIKKGVATVSLGTSTAISVLCNKPVFDKMKRIPCFALDGKSFVLEAVIGTSGAAFKWMRNMFDMDYGDMCSLAEISSVGSNGVFFYPHLNGASSPSWSEDAKGLFYGLTLSTKKSDMMRSLLEGIAFQIKTNLDVCEEVSGEKINEIRLFGGGAKNAIWCRIIANVTGKCVNVPITPETACLGAALLAGGKHEEKTGKTYKPEEALFELYEEIYSGYMMLEEKIY